MWTEEEMATKMNKIHNMDCLEFMKQVPDNYFDLVLTDPPYGIGASKHIHIIKPSRVNSRDYLEKYETKEWDNESPSLEVFSEIIRISKNQIIWGGNYFTDKLPQSNGWIYWDKMYENTFNFSHGEIAWTSFKKRIMQYRASSKSETRGGKDRCHPTQKPKSVMNFALSYSELKNPTVFDPFMGSGTTAIVCKESGIEWCGTELEPDYCDIANKRLSKVQTSMFAFMDEVTA